MMKKFVLIAYALVAAVASFGQLTGIKNIPGSGGPNDYATLAAAIADLNLSGVGPGGVTFNVAAGYTETFPSPTAGTILATGTATRPVIFQKSGIGANPVITAGIGTSVSVDGIIKIAGGDYFTFDGIDLAESAGNTTATTQMEWGYALLKARNTYPIDGCQYITIKNCSITLNGSNTASVGIYSGNHIATTTTPATTGTVYTTSDYSNNCKFYGNTIVNAFKGISLNGYNDNLNNPPTSFDLNNEIGIAGSGNTITQNVSNSSLCYGIWTNNQTNVKIAYNTINCTNLVGGAYGITPRTGNNADIHHNTISVSSSGTSGNNAIDLNSAGTQGYVSEIHDNLIQNCIQSGSGSFSAIYCGTAAPSVLNIYANTITANSAVGGGMTLLSFGGGGGNVNNIYGNLIYNNTKTGAGTLTCIANINYLNCIIRDNQIYSNNINTTGVVTAASTLTGIQAGQSFQSSESIYNNQIYDLNITGTTTATTNFIYGINTDILPTANRTWYNNIVRNLAISAPAASGTVIGMRIANGNTSNVYRNQVYNLMAANAAGVVQGINIPSGTQVNAYNNFISDLKVPASAQLNAVNGITIAGGTNVGLFYNTIYLNASSTAATFGTSGVYKSGATTVADLRNNVIMNLSVPGATSGLSVAFQWTGAFNAAYYGAGSNANNFYAGTPSASRLIFYDGVNTDQTFAGFRSRVLPKDALSFTENSPLMNASVAPYNLHMNPSVPTLCESGGVPVTSPSVTDDIDGNPRSATPDVGANEFAGIAVGVINPTVSTPLVMSSRQVNLPINLNPSGNSVVIVWNTTGFFTAPSGPPPAIGSNFAGGTLLYSGTASPVSHNGLTGGMTYYYKAFSYDGSAYSTGVPVSATTVVAPPVSIFGYGMSSSQIDLVWSKNAMNQNVIVAVNSTGTFGQPVNGTTYVAGNPLPTAGTVIYAGPLSAFSHTGLTTNTTYYYKVWSVDAYAWYSATGASTSVKTNACGPTSSLPFTETFESYTVPALGCGTVVDQNADGVTWVSATTTNINHTTGGTKGLECAAGSTTSDDWYFIQGLNLTAGMTYKLSFWYRGQFTSYPQKFEVKWGTSPTPAGMYGTPLCNVVTATLFISYTEVVSYVTPTATGTYYFGWHNISDAYTNKIFIDDISVTTNTCVRPATASASNITANSADISWTGGAANVQIDYGTAGHAAGAGTVVSASANPFTLTGLNSSTTYDVYVRQDCGLGTYSFWTGPVTFTTAFTPPAVSTDAATALTGAGATLNGTINANGVSTAVYFEYGKSTDYGFVATASPATLTTSVPTPVSATVTGLEANGATYHYRAVGVTGGIATYGADQSFTTPLVAPTVVTAAATAITGTGATLNGTVNANNSASTVTFEYGIDLTYGTVVTATPSSASGSTTINVSAAITGLTAGVTYHYRVAGVNGGGTGNGSDMTFIASDVPTVTTGSYTWTAPATTATLGGLVNANGYSTTVTFQYGTTLAYGSTATVAAAVTGSTPVAVTSNSITVSLNTLYHYRIVAVNSAGTVYGSDMTFTTTSNPLLAYVATTFSASGVSMNGTVNPYGLSTSAVYEYGLTTSYGSTASYAFNPFTSSGTKAAVITGLLPSTVYNFRVTATNSLGTFYGTNQTFTTPAFATPTTLAATNVTATGAKLNGTVATNAATATNFRFEYGLTTAYGTVAPNPTPASGSTNSTFSPTVTLTGLMPNTTYHYRVYAVNATGTATGADMTFTTTAIVPTVTTLAAYGITPATATLGGTVNPNNSSASVTFEYGLTTSYGATATAAQSPLSGFATFGVSAQISGLIPNTVYHYRVTGTNGTGLANGTDMTFTTMAMLPTAVTNAATMVLTTGATLNGSVNANNASTAVTFEYGLTAGYGSVIAATPSPVTGTVAVSVSAAVSGLTPGAVYHYRVSGINTGGTSYGSDMMFATPSADLAFTATAVQPLCFGQTGSVVLNVTGGTEPYTFDPANPAVSGLAPGTYTYHVTDATGVPATASATINAAPSQLVLTATPSQPLCFGQTGSVTLVTTGGTPGYTYNPLNPALTGLASGTYTYWVSDANGCTASADVTINAAPSQLVLTATPQQPCFGQTGSVTLITTGGTPDYTYDPANAALTGLAAGSYSYNVSDANGCSASATVTIDVTPVLVTHAQSTCSPGRIDLTTPAVTAGSILYAGLLSYWLDGAATIPVADPTSVGSGTYYIKATAWSGCSDVQPVQVTVHQLPNMYFVTGGGSYCAGGAGAAVGLSGSQPGVDYFLWTYGGFVGYATGTGFPVSFGLQTTTGLYAVLASDPTTGCINWMYNFTTVSTTQPLPVSVTINASANPAPAGQDVTFTASPVNGGSYPAYQWTVNGLAVGANSAAFTYKPVNGDEVICILTSSEPCVSGNPASSNTVNMVVTGISSNILVTGTVANGQSRCYDALGTITVAGNGKTFTVQNGGDATMIAGVNILLLEGTTVQAGGNLVGRIAPSGPFCSPAPFISAGTTGHGETTAIAAPSMFSVYPNPTTGRFTIETAGVDNGLIKVEIFSILGDKVLTTTLSGSEKQDLSIKNSPAGIYLIRATSGNKTETARIVKQ